MNYRRALLDPKKGEWSARRLVSDPIIHAELHPSIGENIQGPSLIKVPDWVKNPLGKYYLYFADHKGSYIRLAYSEELIGPWHIHEPGSLHLRDSCFPTDPPVKPSNYQDSNSSRMGRLLHSLEFERSTPHIASPDVHVDEHNHQINMYFHGLADYGVQKTRFATSTDGIGFQAEPEILCNTYLRVVQHNDDYIGVLMPGVLFRMQHQRGPFENGERMLPPTARHHALLVNQDQIFLFWTEVGDAPEHIKVSHITGFEEGQLLKIENLGSVLKPEQAWEGANAENKPSVRSVAYGCVNQLRDPCIYVEDERIYLLYAGGGESAIGIAELTWVNTA